MVCGEPAACYVEATFVLTPTSAKILERIGGNAGLVVGAGVEAFLADRIRISCPLCYKHRTHWRKKRWWMALGWLAIVILTFLGCAGGLGLFFAERTSSLAITGGALLGMLLGFLLWFGVLVYLDRTRVRATAWTGESVTFDQVSDAFARAVMGQTADSKGAR
jgi:hypothetical protein